MRFTKEEVWYIADLAHDFAFEDYCQDEEEMQMMDEIKRAAYSCTSDWPKIRNPRLDYNDFFRLVNQAQFDLLFRCMSYKARRGWSELESEIHKKLSTFCVFKPVFNKEEFLNLWNTVNRLTARLIELEDKVK